MAWQLQLWEQGADSVVLLAQIVPSQRPLPPGAVVENGRYAWRLLGNDVSGISSQLAVNGHNLSRDVRGENEVWFPWEVGFNAGIVDLAIWTGSVRHQERVTVDPARAKLNRDDYMLMLRDIIADTRSLAATEGFKAGLARGDAPLPIAQIEFILGHSVAIKHLTTELDRSHRKRLQRTNQTVPLQAARRMSGRDWARSYRHAREQPAATVARLPPSLRKVTAASGNRLPERVLQTNVLADSARREHSEVLGMLAFIASLLRRTRTRQHQLPAKLRDSVLTARCSAFAREVTRLMELPVFTGLSPVRGAWTPSRLYENVEPYRSLNRIHRDLRRGVGQIHGDFVDVSMRETFRLYETWVSLRLIRAAKLLDPTLRPITMFRDEKDASGLTFSLKALDLEFAGRRLRFKPTFNEVWLTDDGVGSFSRQMIPDVVFEFISPRGANRVVILDAKYRVETQLNDAIASIHTYRDALVEEDRRAGSVPSQQRIVTAGFVVVPRTPPNALQPAAWRLQTAPHVFFRRGYQSRYAIGALQLQPGIGVPAVAEMLRDLVRRFS